MMTKEEFMGQMDLVLDGAKVTWDSKLEEIEAWDSIAVVSLVSLLHVPLGGIKRAKTIADLYELVNNIIE